ncbi:P-loop containing nucleoside triphosphate hydrolase protein [Pseudovirgaria hyperparasitica]|uniref:Structural maintenance of chromosomes protein 5 n=1 Tax=Pseudovirgaria hyperparasitica TaxID=470096 RepID=A0A6A6VW93_9PEZI|nr:P-loop containing nucleoside triphosphate hydrolase protein [Pseudovirgaria hyperparasitica]KAF2753511.1 P-loop containing nucleoside triphosphate hydrolase protein [Pseudovirgaria hyperparasitica]
MTPARRSISSDDEDSDVTVPSQNQTPGSSANKRRRLNNGVSHNTQSPASPSSPGQELSLNNESVLTHGSASKFQAGSIVRLKLRNFMAYTAAEIRFGPSLNFIIAPNGSGKSSIVSAICICLGSKPSILGRADQLSDHIHYGKDSAEIEIELAGGHEKSRNHLVRCLIKPSKVTFSINGSPATNAAVSKLCQSLSIQIDNLCQFLPQDPLLEETQRAVAPLEMREWYTQLKELYKKRKSDQMSEEGELERLADLKKKQSAAKQDVDLLIQRNQYKVKIDALEQYRPIVQLRRNFKDAEAQFAQLQKDVNPLLQSTNDKKKYAEQIKQVIDSSEEIDSFDTTVAKVKKSIKLHKDKARDRSMKIADARQRLENAPPEYDSAGCNAKLREMEKQKRELDSQAADIQANLSHIQSQAQQRKSEQNRLKKELEELGTAHGQQAKKLQSRSKDAATAWDWIKENRQQFEGPIYGPPIVECSVKDPLYASAVEGALPEGTLKAFTCTTLGDYNMLQKSLVGREGLRLSDIAINMIGKKLDHWQNIPNDQLAQYGLDGWIVDYLEGPDDVLSMLCEQANIHRHAVTLGEVSQAQYNLLVDSQIQRWSDKNDKYVVSKRYGKYTVATTALRPASVWSDAPVDAGAARPLKQRIDELQDELNELSNENKNKRTELDVARKAKVDLEKTKSDLDREKHDAQQEQAQFRVLPSNIEMYEKQKAEFEATAEQDKQRLDAIRRDQDNLILEKARLSIDHAKSIEALQTQYQSLLEAELMLIEAESEVVSLEEANQAITERLNHARAEKDRLSHEHKTLKAQAISIGEDCKRIANSRSEEVEELHNSFAQDKLDSKSLEDTIEATIAMMRLIRTTNSNAIEEYEARQRKIDAMEEKLATAQERIQRLEDEIKETREQWEPRLDQLVSLINGAFSKNFEAIGCAGEVLVHKDDDFDKWAIQIMVRFRDNEPLCALDARRQSGGERSVSTIFYLLSLQSLARSPFRIVDEINQGMDPRNERMVHKRLVEVSCEENTSQYFLITPKLLPNLNYDPRMLVHCIAAGEFMPKDADTLNFQKLAQVALRVRAAAAS